MLGHRGSRLGISFPEIYQAQARAIIEAACELRKQGVKAMPEIMLPLIGERREFDILAAQIREVADAVFKERGIKVAYTIGTMIEVPRACVVADQIGEVAEFFSFGTNDLTQMTYGISRDDSGKFLPDYIRTGVYKKDPFAELDPVGVGELMRIGIERGRKSNKKLKIGICGEHGGDPRASSCAIGWDSITCRARRTGFRSRGWRRRRRRSSRRRRRRHSRTCRAHAAAAGNRTSPAEGRSPCAEGARRERCSAGHCTTPTRLIAFHATGAPVSARSILSSTPADVVEHFAVPEANHSVAMLRDSFVRRASCAVRSRC